MEFSDTPNHRITFFGAGASLAGFHVPQKRIGRTVDTNPGNQYIDPASAELPFGSIKCWQWVLQPAAASPRPCVQANQSEGQSWPENARCAIGLIRSSIVYYWATAILEQLTDRTLIKANCNQIYFLNCSKTYFPVAFTAILVIDGLLSAYSFISSL